MVRALRLRTLPEVRWCVRFDSRTLPEVGDIISQFLDHFS